jgi:hypothetical protein
MPVDKWASLGVTDKQVADKKVFVPACHNPGFMSPILCAATMGLSDAIVIGNALRLRP